MRNISEQIVLLNRWKSIWIVEKHFKILSKPNGSSQKKIP